MFSLLIMNPNLFMLCIAKVEHTQAPTIIELTGITYMSACSVI